MGSQSKSAGRLQLQDIGKTYGTTPVLKNIDLTVEDGEFLTILGPSGSGKSTILRIIGGFESASSGRLLFGDQIINDQPIHLRPFNTVFQDYALFPHLSVGANTGYGLMVRGVHKQDIRTQVQRSLELVGLESFTERYPAQLSGGQQQRVALARALICSPELILLDEPLAALDAELRRQMQQFLKSLQRQIGITFVFVTHDQEEAITMSDRICLIREGRIEQIGSAEEIYYRPETSFVATFFGDNNQFAGTKAEPVEGAGNYVNTAIGSILSSDPLLETIDANTDVTLAIRPEALRIYDPEDEPSQKPDNCLKVEVTATEFVGPVRQLRVMSLNDSQQSLLVKSTSRRSARAVYPGTRLMLQWDAIDCAVIPRVSPQTAP
jgi:spermidine/putrescine transport system ATP-binding protein